MAGIFPYGRYASIKTEADCLRIIQDETQQWDESFRSTLANRVCKLLGLLNQSHVFQTTHTVVGSPAPSTIDGYEWATASLGIAITIMFRETSARFEVNANIRLVQSLRRMLSSRSFSGDPTGWLLGVWPEVIMYEDTGGGPDIRGYGVELRAAAFADTQTRCAERLSGLLDWIRELLSEVAQQQQGR